MSTKHKLIIFLFLFLLNFGFIKSYSAELKIMTYNNVGKVDTIQNYAKANNIDIIGFQEFSDERANDLKNKLNNVGYPMNTASFTYLGGKKMYFYYKPNITLVDTKTTSYYADRGALNLLLDTPIGRVRLINHHPPNNCEINMAGFNYAQSFNDPNYILLGDHNIDYVRGYIDDSNRNCFNFVRSTYNYSCMNNDKVKCRASSKPGSTIGFCESKEDTIYDFIMTPKNSDFYLSDYYTENNMCMSDHYPVVAVFKLKKDAFNFNNDSAFNLLDIFSLINAIINTGEIKYDVNLDRVVDMKDFFEVAKYFFK